MHVTGIVAEYNPFHTGHKYHIEKARAETAADGIVAIMSGSFVQRGEPAVYDKWTRALHALRGGADLVLELPALYALSSAEGFAKGAVETLRGTGVVDTLSFGSECGQTEPLRRAAEILEEEPLTFRSALQEHLKAGRSYAAARMLALETVDKEAAQLLTKPNNILAISYMRVWGKGKAHTMKRMGADYLDTEPGAEFASALSLRQKLFAGERIDTFVSYETEGLIVRNLDMYENLLLYALQTTNWQTFASIGEAVKKRLENCNGESLQKALESAKTKHIPMAAIKRALMQILLQNAKGYMPPSYIRVLGFNARGTEILKEMKKTAQLPVITRPAAFKENCPIWELEKRATDIYFLPEHLTNQDVKRAPVQI